MSSTIHPRRLLSLIVLALAGGTAMAAECPNRVGYVFTVDSNVEASAFVLSGDSLRAEGSYAASLALTPEIMAQWQASLAAGCGQRVSYSGARTGSWTWNLGRTTISSAVRLLAHSNSRGRTWSLGRHGIGKVVLTGLADQFLVNEYPVSLDLAVPLNVARRLGSGDTLNVTGQASVLVESLGGGLYDQASANASWSMSYFPFLFIDLP